MKRVGAVVYPGFQSLDLYGPIDMFGMLEDELAIEIVATGLDAVASAQGPHTLPDIRFADADPFDILLLPGGPGSRSQVDDPAFLDQLCAAATHAGHVASVCTGSALLARTGLLDGRAATSNKAALAWVETQGPAVKWQPRARWVVDGKFYTSSGVSAGMDMSLALIAELYGIDTAHKAARSSEYRWVNDAGDDPFCDDRFREG